MLRPTLLATLLAVALLALSCGGGDEAPATAGDAATTTPDATAAGPAPPADGGAVLEIAAVPTIKFDKTELRAPAGVELTARFDNSDTGLPHNWALYRDDGFSEPVAGANEQICTAPCKEEVTFGPLEPGTYYFRCDVHPTLMKGELIVE